MDAGLECEFIIHFDVSWDKTEFLLDLADDLEIWGAIEGISSLMEEF